MRANTEYGVRLKFSRRQLLRLLLSLKTKQSVVWHTNTDVSQERTASNF
jgi:hypothetical protein